MNIQQPELPVIHLPDEEATSRLGRSLGAALLKLADVIGKKGLNVRLDGTLGAGKTTTARAALRSLGVAGRVRSPTFTLLETYEAAGFTVGHFDFYRFESPEEFDEAGFRDFFGPGRVTLCEWAEKAGGFLPRSDLAIEFRVEGTGRSARLAPITDEGTALAREVAGSWT